VPNLTNTIRQLEKKVTSQNGEDGILEFLLSQLKVPNGTFIEIGCSDGTENNSRHLMRLGMSGTGVDISWTKLLKHKSLLGKLTEGSRLDLKCMRVTLRNCLEILTWQGLRPDVFSLDIDSYDYFIADALLKSGFSPSIVCLETNTFLGEDPVTVDYIENFSRYQLQPDYGLYFGASPNAWRNLWQKYGYKSLGLDSTGTNIFLVHPERIQQQALTLDEPPDVHQNLFVAKYKTDGNKLCEILRNTQGLCFLNVNSSEYEDRFSTAAPTAIHSDSALFVTTFIKKTYEEVAYKLVESFDQRWPKRYQFLALSEGCNVTRTSERILTAELATFATGLNEFKQRHRFNPGANGHFGSTYNYVFDCVKWSHKVFAVEVAAEYTDAEYAIYIDADIFTFDTVPDDFLASIMMTNADIAYMPRKNMYSECSFVIYRLRNPLVRSFIFEHTEAYRSDKIFQLPGWTDCHIFDALVAKYSKANLLKFHNINEGVPQSMHPFINGPLGKYMDHMKGARKTTGKSYDSDLVVQRSERYWLEKTNPKNDS
jgi:hypothetical protein